MKMIRRLKTYAKGISRIADTSKIDEHYKTKTINQFCLITLSIATILAVVFFTLQYYKEFGVTVFAIISFLTVLLLNHYKYFVSAKTLIVLSTSASIVSVTYYTGYNSGFYLYLYTAPVLLFWIFDFEKEKRHIIISAITYLASYINTLFFTYNNPPIIIYTHLNFEFTLYDLNSIAALLILFILFKNYATYFSKLQDELLQEKENLREEIFLRKQDQIKLKKLYNEVKVANVNLEQFGFMVCLVLNKRYSFTRIQI